MWNKLRTAIAAYLLAPLASAGETTRRLFNAVADLAAAGKTTRPLFLFNAMVGVAALGAAASLLGRSNPPEATRVG